MTQTLSHALSPLEQARAANKVAVHDARAQLSHRDQADLKTVLTTKYDFVDDAAFYEPDAERNIFDEAEEIPKPDTAWYHPVMENIAETKKLSNSTGTVLLTAAQERVIFLQFNYCRYRAVELKEKIGDGRVSAADARELLKWYRRGEQLRDQIAQTNLALVLAMAKRTRMSEVDFADLVSEGNMALLRAVDKFDVSRGFKFSTYACRAILKAFSRTGVKHSKYRQLFPTDFDPKLEKSDHQENRRQEHEGDCVDELKQMIVDNRADLTDIEQEVIEHRFGIGEKKKREPEAQPMTLEQVGRIIGVTKERVRQIQNKALDKLRNSLEDSYLN